MMLYSAGGYCTEYFPLIVAVTVHPPLGFPPLRVRNVSQGRPSLSVTAGGSRIRATSGKPTVTNEEGSD